MSRPTIGPGGGAWREVGVDEGVQAGGEEIVHLRQPHPARPIAPDFDGAGNAPLRQAAVAAAAGNRVGFGG